MTWTKEAPTVIGWYWYRENGKLAMRHIVKGSESAGRTWYLIDNMGRVPLPARSFKGEWYGPVTPPE